MDLNFGITSTEEITGEGGDSFLFADDKPEKIQESEKETSEEPKEEEELPTKSFIFSEEEVEEPTDEGDSLEPVQDDLEEGEDEDGDEEGDISSNQFGELSQDLVNLGIFTQEEGEDLSEIDTPEKFASRWQVEKQKAAHTEITNFLSQFGKKYIDAFNSIFVNGVDPEVYFQKQTSLESFQEADIEDEFVAEKVVKAYYSQLGWKEDRIAKKIERLKDYDDLKDEAEVAKDHLVKREQQSLQQIEQARIQQIQAKKQQEAYLQQGMHKILAERLQYQEFDGIPLNNRLASEVYDDIVTKKWSLPSGEQLSDFDVFLMDLKKPENFELAAKISLLRKTGFDFSKIKTSAISKESNELFKSLKVKEKVSKRTSKPDNFTL